jgi:hypothetical protein
MLITGELNLHLKRGAFSIQATGSLAVVAMVYLYAPKLSDSAHSLYSQTTTYGDKSPIIQENSGSI